MKLKPIFLLPMAALVGLTVPLIPGVAASTPKPAATATPAETQKPAPTPSPKQTLTPAPTPAPAAATPEGAELFNQRCKTCHTVEPDKRSPLGPNLAGVVGRKAASGDFSYSAALKASKLTWDRETLDRYLASPARLVRGTRMYVGVSDKEQRAAIIDYLAGIKG